MTAITIAAPQVTIQRDQPMLLSSSPSTASTDEARDHEPGRGQEPPVPAAGAFRRRRDRSARVVSHCREVDEQRDHQEPQYQDRRPDRERDDRERDRAAHQDDSAHVRLPSHPRRGAHHVRDQPCARAQRPSGSVPQLVVEQPPHLAAVFAAELAGVRAQQCAVHAAHQSTHVAPPTSSPSRRTRAADRSCSRRCCSAAPTRTPRSVSR